MEDFKENILKEARRVEEDSLYSAKGHFVAASFWMNFHFWVGVPTAILAAIAGASALSKFDYHEIVAAGLSIIVAALTAVMTFLNPNEKSNSYLNAGNKYNSLRNRARIFYEIDFSTNVSDQDLSQRLKVLAEQRDELNRDCPQVPTWAYKRGKESIEKGEANYVVDKRGGT